MDKGGCAIGRLDLVSGSDVVGDGLEQQVIGEHLLRLESSIGGGGSG